MGWNGVDGIQWNGVDGIQWNGKGWEASSSQAEFWVGLWKWQEVWDVWWWQEHNGGNEKEPLEFD